MGTKKKKSTKNNTKNTPVKGKSVSSLEKKTTLGDIIKDADQAIVISVNKGQIEVTGIKNINYSFEAKGLLVGAMDIYNNRPIISGLNNNTRALMSHIMNLSNKLDKIIGPTESTKV